MNARSKETADETRERITGVAEDLFRRLGFAKTAVADIAAELGMSPANVYRFFPSKTAIVTTICSRRLTEIETEITGIARAPGSPQERIFGIFLAILRYHKANFFDERRIHDMVVVAIDNNWDAIEAHKARIRSVVAEVLEDGIRSGVFVAHDPAVVACIILSSLVLYCHPLLVAQHIDGNLEADLKSSLTFLLRGVETERTPLA